MSPALLFVSSNPNKILEVERMLGLPVRSIRIDLPEIQAGSLEEIARTKLRTAVERVEPGGGFLLVEDVSLGLTALGGFPGPYVKWLLQSAGGEGLATMAAGVGDAHAVARCCVACWDGEQEHLFVGEVAGRILPAPRGTRRFGWDAWFQPDGSSFTYAEMPDDEKDRISHRALAWRRASELLASVIPGGQ